MNRVHILSMATSTAPGLARKVNKVYEGIRLPFAILFQSLRKEAVALKTQFTSLLIENQRLCWNKLNICQGTAE